MKRNIMIIGLILIYPMLFIWQGLDFTDTGYSASNSYFIFTHPEYVERGFILWLTNIIGGVWLLLFDSLGLIGFRFASVLIIYITVFFSYLILKEILSKTSTLIWILLSLVIIERIYWIHYNHLTALFFVAGFYFLLLGLKTNRYPLFYLSGMIMGASILVRFPNILGLSFILLIWLFYSVSRKIRMSLLFILGYCSSLLLAYCCMFILNHDELFNQAILQIFQSASGTGSHGTTSLLEVYIKQFKGILKVIIYISLLFIIQYILLLLSKRIGSAISYFSYIIVVPVGFYFYQILFDRDSFLTAICAIIIFVLVIAFFFERGKPMQRTIIFAAILILLLIPLGSDIGVRNAGFGMYLAVPLTFHYLLVLMRELYRPFSNSEQPKYLSKYLSIFIIAIITTFGMVEAYNYTYRDIPNRGKMVYTVDHPKLKGIFTTKERAFVIGELLDELPKHVEEEGSLLAVEAIPMLHYITGIKPYLYATWPMLNEPPQFKESLSRAQATQEALPTIVLTKSRTTSFTWPDDSGRIANPRYIDNRKTIEEFLKAYPYKKIWENSFFEIYKPS